MDPVKELGEIATWMYRKGWDERNGGNISLRLRDEEMSGGAIQRTWKLPTDLPELRGERFLVTGTGKYFRTIAEHPERDMGVVRISEDGKQLELLWGFSDGGGPTSELASHLLCHAARMRTQPDTRVVMHCHPTNLVTMSYVHELDERQMTRTLWGMSSECIVVFPDGVGVLPWMVCGTEEIGRATAKKLEDRRLVLWPHHGIFAAGNGLDEAFGLIETVEKAAEIYLKIAPMGMRQTINDRELAQLAERFSVSPRSGYLDDPESNFREIGAGIFVMQRNRE